MSATVDDALFAILDADAPLAALVGDAARVFPGLGPEGGEYPCVIFRHIGSQPTNSMSGYSKLRQTSFDFECWADTPSQAIAVAQAVLVAFDGWGHYQEPVAAGNVLLNSVLFSGEAHDYDDVHAKHGMTYSFDVTYNEAV